MTTMTRVLAIGYGAVSYLLFLTVFLYAIGFVGDVAVPRSVDDAVGAPPAQALIVNLSLLTLFAVQHSVMARPAFKRWWTRYVPSPVERSTYVLLASLVLALLFWQWRTIPFVVWEVTYRPARLAVWTLFWLGWLIVLAATFMSTTTASCRWPTSRPATGGRGPNRRPIPGLEQWHYGRGKHLDAEGQGRSRALAVVHRTLSLARACR